MTGDIQLIDTHLHLHLAQFDTDREQAIERAQAVQVEPDISPVRSTSKMEADLRATNCVCGWP